MPLFGCSFARTPEHKRERTIASPEEIGRVTGKDRAQPGPSQDFQVGRESEKTESPQLRLNRCICDKHFLAISYRSHP